MLEVLPPGMVLPPTFTTMMFQKCLHGDRPVSVLFQSDTANIPADVAPAPSNPTVETVQFDDATQPFCYDLPSSSDYTREAAADEDQFSIDNFFSRPLNIHTFTWQPGVSHDFTIDPWSLYLENKRVINRIANYSLFSADKMVISVRVNGNQFYYGRCLMSYEPLPGMSESDETYMTGFLRLMMYSQRPHAYINPTNSEGCEMSLPFMWPENKLRIKNGDWSQLGRLSFDTLFNLHHAMGSNNSITVQLFAHLEGVSLTVPTSFNPSALIPQSGEYSNSPVSAMATTVARVAGMLGNVPVIGKFAKATQMAASAAGGIAALFGFSRPRVLDSTKPFVPRVAGNLSVYNSTDNSMTLALDNKQEVTIDPSVTGVNGDDELSIKSLVTREALFSHFPIQLDDAPGKLLWNCAVTPSYGDYAGSSGGDEWMMTPAAYTASCFGYWGGTMKYRFMVVASDFHKARLRFVWDPVASPEAEGALPDGPEWNTTKQWVVDISETKDFTVAVGWGQPTSYLRYLPPFATTGVDSGSNQYFNFCGHGSAVQPIGFPKGFVNGVLSCYLVNELTTPADPSVSQHVQVAVFSSMLNDARFANPIGDAIQGTQQAYNFLSSKSEEDTKLPDKQERSANGRGHNFEIIHHSAAMSADDPQDAVVPISQDIDHMFGTWGSESDNMTDVFFGEEIVSVRQLLKRFCYHSTFGANAGPYSSTDAKSLAYCRLKLPAFPYYIGRFANSLQAANLGGVSVPYSYCSVTFLNHFAPCFVAWRGSLRWKVVASEFTSYHIDDPPFSGGKVLGFQTKGDNGYLYTERCPNLTYQNAGIVAGGIADIDVAEFTGLPAPPPTSSFSLITSSETYNNITNRKVHSTDGAVVTPLVQNSVNEIEVPYYTNLRFSSARRLDVLKPIPSLTMDGINASTPIMSRERPQSFAVTYPDTHKVDLYQSIGEDFNLSFFLNVPVVKIVGAGSNVPLPPPFNYT